MRFEARLLKKADALLTNSLLDRIFKEMDQSLGSPASFEVMGGTAMVLLGIKNTTRDIDLVSELPEGCAKALPSLEETFRLQKGWINEDLNRFETIRDPQVLWEGNNLRVLGPGPEELFVTKASITRRDKDLDDVLAIVKHQGWSYEEAENLYRTHWDQPLPQAVYYHLLYGLAA